MKMGESVRGGAAELEVIARELENSIKVVEK